MLKLASVILALVTLTVPLAAEAQQTGALVRIGVLSPQSRETSAAGWAAFRQGLRDLAEELLTLNVSLIVSQNSPGTHAAIVATKTVPIVMVEVGDPVATGFVTNLAAGRERDGPDEHGQGPDPEAPPDS